MNAAACGAPCCRPPPPASPATTRPSPPRPMAHAVCIATTSMALTTSSSTTPTPAKSSSPSIERKTGATTMKKQQSGFTMIELIMVIVVLGILAAFALPRFANFSGDARLAAMQGAAGAVKSASAIVHAAALADPKTASNGTISVEVDVALVGTYAAPTEEGIALAAQL